MEEACFLVEFATPSHRTADPMSEIILNPDISQTLSAINALLVEKLLAQTKLFKTIKLAVNNCNIDNKSI